MKCVFRFEIVILFCANIAFANVNTDTHFVSELKLNHHRDISFTSAPAKVFMQEIDHFGALPGQKFKQRYWVDSQFATSKAAPVIYHICGEGDVDSSYFLNDSANDWARALGARLVYLEHRYYGQSNPFADISNEHIKYLTLRNEIEDLANFQRQLSSENGWTGKWLVVGGSYSGTISALYRFLHPELVVGALASSAPMISGVGEVFDVTSANQISSPVIDGSMLRAWSYQACSIFGFWMANASIDEDELFLPTASLCKAAYGNDAPYFNSNDYNQKYGLPFISPNGPSNILFTYGTKDPWTLAGLQEAQNQNVNIQILKIANAGHHFDLNIAGELDSKEVIHARKLFLNLSKKWLFFDQDE